MPNQNTAHDEDARMTTPQSVPSNPGGAEPHTVIDSLYARIQQLETNTGLLENERQKLLEWQNMAKAENEVLRVKAAEGGGVYGIDVAQALVTITKAITEDKRKARVPAPTEYDGSKEKLPIFKKELKDWFADNKVTDDQEKIRLTMGYMKKGDVAVWATQQSEDGTTWNTYEELLCTIQSRFGDLDPQYTARQKLEKTKQTGSVEDYNTEFKKYARKTGFSDADLADKYQKGLNDAVIKSIYGSGTLPTSLQEWTERALHFDHLFERLRQLRPSARNAPTEGPRVPNRESQPARPQARAGTDYVPGTTGPMDIDTARREGKCRFCRQPWDGPKHSCEGKKRAQAAYEKRQQAKKQRREMQMEADGELVAKLKDELEVMRKRFEEVKEEGD